MLLPIAGKTCEIRESCLAHGTFCSVLAQSHTLPNEFGARIFIAGDQNQPANWHFPVRRNYAEFGLCKVTNMRCKESGPQFGELMGIN